MPIIKATVFGALLVATVVAAPANARRGDIVLSAGLDCYFADKPPLQMDSTAHMRINCTYGDYCRNDDYKSVWIANTVTPGTVIKVWDDSKGSTRDDWAVITVKSISPTANSKYGGKGGICVRSFEADIENDQYKLVYHRKDNLNGKVSLIEVTPGPPPPPPPAPPPPVIKKIIRKSL